MTTSAQFYLQRCLRGIILGSIFDERLGYPQTISNYRVDELCCYFKEDKGGQKTITGAGVLDWR